MRRTTTTAVLVATLAWGLPSWAANPALDAHERGIDDPSKHTRELGLAELSVRVDIVGGIAESSVTARFDNPTDDDLEGEFRFELPPGAVVTGYALDIEGRLVDGVLVDPLKARREFQERVREKVDPGVAHVSRANVISTKVYPIPARGGRTIRLRFAAPIDSQRGVSIPFSTQKPVGKFNLEIHAEALSNAPALTLPARLEAAWKSASDGWVANAQLAGQPLSGELAFSNVRPSANALSTRHSVGRRFFHIQDSAVSRANDAHPKRLRVYWDRSLSRRDDRLGEELTLLGQYLEQAKPSSIELVVFNSSGARAQTVRAEQMVPTLRSVLYRGATSFAVLENLETSSADVCLVFSDGVVTIDARRDLEMGCQVFAITSASDADSGYLRRLARAGGEVLRLGQQTDAQILARLRGAAPVVVDARTDDGNSLRFAVLESATGWSVVGEAPETGAVILRVAGIERNVVERRYALTERRASFDGAGSLWAADRVAELAAVDGAHAAMVDLSRQFSVASPSLSFIVLERPDDYVEAGIAPPANYPKEGMKEYRERKAEYDEAKRQAVSSRLADIREMWEEQKDWWKTKFDPAESRRALKRNSPPPPAPASAGAPSQIDSIRAEDIGGVSDANRRDDMSEIMVTGVRASMQASVQIDSAPGPTIGVQMEEWKPDRPYLKALDQTAPAMLDRVLAREEQKNSSLPAFYFDVAEWLFRKKRSAEAVEMLLSALELPAANEETVSMVADRLLRYGRMDRAIWLYERAHEQTDYLPQPRRTLALALAKRAATSSPARARTDLVRAVSLLNEVVMTPWEDDYDGVEMVALMEANLLLPALQALDVSDIPLDDSLRALLAVDIRVIIEWNTGATDMDLWVDEPTGERAIYSHPKTAVGGRLSNDMTEGYGPEEYLLRRAVPGEYGIRVNVYASDSINPNGTTVVTAHLFRNYGRADQQEETMEIELRPGDEGVKSVGRFRVN